MPCEEMLKETLKGSSKQIDQRAVIDLGGSRRKRPSMIKENETFDVSGSDRKRNKMRCDQDDMESVVISLIMKGKLFDSRYIRERYNKSLDYELGNIRAMLWNIATDVGYASNLIIPPGQEEACCLFPPIILPDEEEEVHSKHLEQVLLSDGFDASVFPTYPPFREMSFLPTPIDDSHMPLTPAATLAIYHYNHRHLSDTPRHFVFSKLLRAMSIGGRGCDCRITFEATDGACHRTFRARVFCDILYKYLQVSYCIPENQNGKPEGTFPPKMEEHLNTLARWPAETSLPSFDKSWHPCFKLLDDLDAKTAAAVANFLLTLKQESPEGKKYLFSKLVSASFTSIYNACVFNVTFEATTRFDSDGVRTFEAVVWQFYPSFNLEVEYCRLKNEEKAASGLDAQ